MDNRREQFGTHRISIGHGVSIEVSSLAYEKFELIADVRNSGAIYQNNLAKRRGMPSDFSTDCTAEYVAEEISRLLEAEFSNLRLAESIVQERLVVLLDVMLGEAITDLLPRSISALRESASMGHAQ